MRYVSLFAGIGGFDLALNRLGHECVYANDFDKYCKITYEKNFSNQTRRTQSGEEWEHQRDDVHVEGFGTEAHHPELDTRPITTVPTSDIPDHDLLVGGFPCQAFSIAGKRRGFDDTRGTLFFEIARILKDKRPGHFILENVKGLLSHDEGKTFQTILGVLTDLGYEYQWQVLNSKNFGVPQNRERVFIVGNLRGQPRPKIFPITGGNQQDESERVLAHTLNSSDWRGANRNQKQTTIRTDQPDSSQGGDKSDSSNTIRRTSYTDGARIRRLTPMECERLQGFPDGWTEGVSDTQRYKQLGNAVTVNVVEYVASHLPHQEQEAKE